MKELDNLHINFRSIDGHHKPFVAVISSREAGKSTQWIKKAYDNFKSGKTSLIIRRQVVDITEAYIFSIQEVINKFFDEGLEFTFKKNNLKDGIVFIFVKEKIFACVIALSISIARAKSLVLRNVKNFFFDEFIINPNFKEKYLPDEATRFKEIYNTFYREAEEMITCYFLGNPYSHYNPYFMWWGVDTKKLTEGSIQSGNNWIVWCYSLSEDLKKYILERNPLYEFDDSYTRYGFNGIAVCDENIKLGTLPNNYSLKFIFRIEGKYIGVYQNQYWEDHEDKYYCQFIEEISEKRVAYCFDFSELISRCALVSNEDRSRFNRFKISMRKRLVAFSNINCYYLIEEIFNQL